MTPLDDLTALKVEYLALRGVFVECLYTFMFRDPEIFNPNDISRSIDRVQGFVLDRALAVGKEGDPVLLAHIVRTIEAYRGDLIRDFDELVSKEPISEPEVRLARRMAVKPQNP